MNYAYFTQRLGEVLYDSTPFNAPEAEVADLRCCECKNFLTRLPIIWYFDSRNSCGRCANLPFVNGIRNTALEALIKLVNLPCRWEGCTKVLKSIDVQKHEEECDYRKYECPTVGLGCAWTGLRKEIEKHFETVHEHCILNEDKSLPLALNRDLTRHIFYKYNNVNFILRLKYEKSLDSIFTHLYSFSRPAEGKQFVFVLTLLNNEKTRKYEATINHCTTYINEDKYNWHKISAMNEMDLQKLAHLVKGETIIQCKLSILEEPTPNCHKLKIK